MFGEKIEIDGQLCHLGPYLASGLIGVVFPAFAEGDTLQKPIFAVKVPAANLTENLKKRFRKEFDVLVAVRKKWSELYPEEPSPFPAVYQVTLEQKEAFAMEFVPDETILSRVLQENDLLKRERQYVQASLQYAKMLRALHQAGYICPDRKTDDVRWIAEQARLVVLDWNVVEPLNSAEVDKKQEYAIFGSLWYQYLTGKVPPESISLLDDDAWQGLTLGTREILDGLLHGRYNNDDALIETLKTWQNNLGQDPQVLFDSLPDETIVKKDVDGWWSRLVLLDLARRYQADPYEAQYQDFLSKFLKRVNRIFFDCQMALLRGKYEEGLAFLKRIRGGLWQGKDSTLKLMWARWGVLMQEALTAQKKGESFFEKGRAFQAWFDAIAEHTESEKEFWLEENSKFPSDLIKSDSVLMSLKLEILIREGQIRLSEIAVDDYSERNKSILEIENNAEKLRKIHPDYCDALLEDILPDLDVLKRTVKRALDLEGSIFSASNTLKSWANPALREYLLRRIRDAFGRDNTWMLAMQRTVDDIATLSDYLAGNQLPDDEQVRSLLVRLFSNPEVGILFNEEFRQTLQEAFETLPFAPGERGILQKFSIASHILWLGETKFPVFWNWLEPVCDAWQEQAIQEAEEMLLRTNQTQALQTLEQEWLPFFEQNMREG